MTNPQFDAALDDLIDTFIVIHKASLEEDILPALELKTMAVREQVENPEDDSDPDLDR